MNNCKVSVVLPCFNGERFIEKQVMSILNQSHKAIELIIVDDKSTDNTASIISQLSLQFSQIKFYQNPTNLGLNKNFEKAISLATGDLIALSDQDDIWLPTKVEELMNAIGDHWLVFSNSRLINEDDEQIDGTLIHGLSIERLSFKSISINNFVTGHTTLFKKEILKFALPFPIKGYYDWWLGFVATYHNKITLLNKNLTLYRIHSASYIQQQEEKVNNDEVTSAELNYNSTLINLHNVSNYKYLKEKDKRFLRRLMTIYRIKKKTLAPLTFFYYLHFNDLFPETRKRKIISKTRWKLAKYFAKS